MIKVGDWVKVGSVIGRVIKTNGDMAIVKTLETTSSQYVEDLTMLPIKFKPFEINKNLQVYEKRVIKGHKYPIQFMSTDDNFAAFSYCKKGVMFGTMGNRQCVTRDQAKDWLEFQYTTMLAKAMGINLKET